MKDSLTLRFLYKTILGRTTLKLLVHPRVSKIAGRFLSSRASKPLVPYYIKKHRIDMDNIEIPPDGFSSFNDFFTRKHIIEYCDLTQDHLISPCDGLLTPVDLSQATVFDIKNTKFSLEDLLKDRKLAAKFQDGLALVFRLTPANYHRYCYVADGKVLCSRRIHGKLHCVRPIALRTVPVFTQNSREYQVLASKRFGTVIQMEIGALLVGKIKNQKPSSDSHCVQAGEEKGYFEFGGSTIIVLLPKDTVCLNEELYAGQDENGEIPVSRGEYVAKAMR